MFGSKENEISFQVMRKKVPEGILFGEQVLVTPTLLDLGVPIPLAFIAFTKIHHQKYSWVDEGDPFVTYYFWVYKRYTGPESGGMVFPSKLFGKNKAFLAEITLNSPTSGLLLHSRQTGGRGEGYLLVDPNSHMRRYDFPSHSGLIEHIEVAPSLLVPKGTRDPDTEQLRVFATDITSFIYKNWKMNVHNTGQTYNYKRKRFNDRIYNLKVTPLSN